MRFPNSRAARIALYVLFGATAVAILYVAALNVLLRTALLRTITNGNPLAVRIGYRNAWSWIPGRVVANDVVIRGSDTSVQWNLTVEHVEFDAHLLDLFRKRFYASRVRASGVAMHLRFLVDDDASPDHLASVPPIPGFPGPPVRLFGAELPPISDEDYALWSVRLEDVEATHVRDVWIDSLRFEGDLHVTGRWIFRPLRWLEVGPAHVDFHEGKVSSGGNAFARSLEGPVEATVVGHDVREPVGIDIVRKVSASVELQGAASLSALFNFVKTNDAVVALPCEGAVSTKLRIERGQFLPGSFATTRCPNAALFGEGFRVDGDVLSSFRVDELPPPATTPGDPPPHALVASKWNGRLEDARVAAGAWRMTAKSIEGDADRLFAKRGEISVDRAQFAVVGASGRMLPKTPAALGDAASAPANGAIVEVPKASLTATRVVFPEGAPSGQLTFAMPNAALPDFAALSRAFDLPPSLRLTGGRGEVSLLASQDLSTGYVSMEGSFETTHLDARLGTMPYRGKASAALHAKGSLFEPAGADVSKTIVSLDGAAGGSPWWARVTFPSAVTSLSGGPHFRGRVHVVAKDASPAMSALASESGIPDWAISAFSTKGLVADGEFRVGGDELVVRKLQATVEDIKVRGAFVQLGKSGDGALYLEAPRFRVGITLGDRPREIHFLGTEAWFEREAASLDRRGARGSPQLLR